MVTPKTFNFEFQTYSKLGQEVLLYRLRETLHQPELLTYVVIFENWFIVQFAEALDGRI